MFRFKKRKKEDYFRSGTLACTNTELQKEKKIHMLKLLGLGISPFQGLYYLLLRRSTVMQPSVGRLLLVWSGNSIQTHLTNMP
jgi:hypothetical protein